MEKAVIDEISSRRFESPDETRSFEKGHIDLVHFGSITLGRITLEPGWRWALHVKPIAGTSSCEAGHLQYILSGRMHIVMDDGTEAEFGRDEVISIPPGHDGWVVGNEPFIAIDVTGLADYAKKS